MSNLKFYVINLRLLDEDDASLDFGSMPNYEFMTISAKYGEVYSPTSFENLINNDDFDAVNCYIRIIED
jgi:hypothetical protein